mgnify:CR=1 FL=1
MPLTEYRFRSFPNLRRIACFHHTQRAFKILQPVDFFASKLLLQDLPSEVSMLHPPSFKRRLPFEQTARLQQLAAGQGIPQPTVILGVPLGRPKQAVALAVSQSEPTPQGNVIAALGARLAEDLEVKMFERVVTEIATDRSAVHATQPPSSLTEPDAANEFV